MSLIGLIAVICGLFLSPAVGEAMDEDNYRLLIKQPFEKFQRKIDEEFGLMSLSELNAYFDQQDGMGREWEHVLPEILKGAQMGLDEFGGNAFNILKEKPQFLFLKDLEHLADRYLHPRLDIAKGSGVLATLRRPRGQFEGVRFGLSLNVENPTRLDELVTLAPYVMTAWNSVKFRFRYNIFHGLKASIENDPAKLWNVTLRGSYVFDLDGRHSFDLSAARPITEKKDIWAKIKFGTGNVFPRIDRARPHDLEQGWHMGVFIFGRW